MLWWPLCNSSNVHLTCRASSLITFPCRSSIVVTFTCTHYLGRLHTSHITCFFYSLVCSALLSRVGIHPCVTWFHHFLPGFLQNLAVPSDTHFVLSLPHRHTLGSVQDHINTASVPRPHPDITPTFSPHIYQHLPASTPCLLSGTLRLRRGYVAYPCRDKPIHSMLVPYANHSARSASRWFVHSVRHQGERPAAQGAR